MKIKTNQYLLSLVFLYHTSLATGTECGIRHSRWGRTLGRSIDSKKPGPSAPLAGLIVGGSPVRQGDYPWLASIYRNNKQYCGGSIIDPEWILTAAHCFVSKKKVKRSIRVGSSYRGWGKKHDVVKVIKHPDFKHKEYYSDIALLKVSPPIQYTTGKYGINVVGPICMPEPNVEYTGDATVAGWGTVSSEEKRGSLYLLATDINILSNDDCKQYEIFDPNVSLCAGVMQGSKDSCQGDSGGPLQAIVGGKVYQIGIVSYGEGCGMPGKPGVYTRLQRFLPWVQAQIKADKNQS